jgi:hypothetical protein
MEELFNIGISLGTIRSMIEFNPEIQELTSNDILEKIELLKMISCKENQISNIISSNSLYLTKTKEEYIKLIEYLTKIGFTNLNILFDSNPYILNIEISELKQYITQKSQEYPLEDLIDELESSPYLFNEII